MSRSGLFLEREDDQLRLSRMLEDAVESDGTFVVAAGPAGIGKTRLLREARGLAGERGDVVVLTAQGGEIERELAWGVARELLDPPLAAMSASDRAALFSGAGGLARAAFGVAPAGAGVPDAASMIYGLYWVVTELAARRPTVLVIDDVQWADEMSLRWLAYLGARLEGLSLAVLVAVRTGDPDARRPEILALSAVPGAVRIEPAPLSVGAVGQMIAAGGAQPEDAFVAGCHEVTGGNPFLVEELIRQLGEERVEPSDANAGRVRGLRPATIARSVLLRLARLPAEATWLARAVAILGGGAEARDAGAVAQLDPEATARAHAALADAEILTGHAQLGFVHPLIAGTVYEEMPGLERSLWHERAARSLAAAGARVEDVVPHLLETEPGRDGWVRGTLRAGGRMALERGAPELAARLLWRARREAGTPGEECELLLELGRAEFAARGAAGLSTLETALAVAPDADRRVAIALELGRGLQAVGNHPRAAAVYGETLASLSDARADLRRLMRAHYVYTALQDAATLTQALAALREGTAEIGSGGPADDIIRACMAVGTAAAGAPGCSALAEQALTSGWLVAERTPALAFAAMALTWADELPRAAALWDQALARGRELGERPWLSFAACFRSHVAYRIGDVALAEEYGREAVLYADIWDLTPPEPAAFLCDALLEQGKLAEALDTLERCDYDPTLPHTHGYNALLFTRGRLRLATGDIDQAIADLRELGRRLVARRIVNPSAYPWRSTLAGALAASAPDEASSLAAQELQSARAFGAPRALGIALRAVALLERGEIRLELLREAVEVLHASPARLELARTHIALGASLRQTGRSRDAREVLRAGADEAHRCGAGALAAVARTELVAAGARPRRDALRGRDALTASETRVARLAAEGKRNRQIAQELFVTLRTVETHLTSVYRKLDLTTRQELPDALAR
jgi:DNA-binding CsgD family transcriptional regulator